MKIVVCSDTHGDFGPLRTILLRESYADCYLHLGDIGGTLEEIRPFAAVRGNCDMFRAGLPLWREVMTPMGKICCHHRPVDGHALRDLAEDGCVLFLHGHTHRKEEDTEGEIPSLCPGSCSFPRDGTASYLVLTVEKDGYKADFKLV